MKKKNKVIEKTKTWISNNPILFLTSLVILTLSSTVSLVQNSLKLYDYSQFLDSNIRKHNSAQNKINNLGIGLQLDYYKSILGEPAIVNTFTGKLVPVFDSFDSFDSFDGDQLDAICRKHKEYIFIDDLFFTQVVANIETNTIALYTITSRDKDFKPMVENYHINKDYLSKHEYYQDIIQSIMGAKYFEYTETHYHGNADFYRTHYLSINPSSENLNLDSTTFDHMGSIDFLEDGERGSFITNNQNIINKFRSGSTFNTAGFSEDGFEHKCFGVGPNPVQTGQVLYNQT